MSANEPNTAAIGEDRILSQEEVDDPWNLWVFRINARGDYDAESARESWEGRASFNASRLPTFRG